jgi:hypothetical protein
MRVSLLLACMVMAALAPEGRSLLQSKRVELRGGGDDVELLTRAGISPEDVSKLVCVGVCFGTSLELPEPLRSFVQLLLLSGEVTLDVEKQVCQLGRVIFEDVLVCDGVVYETRIWTRTETTSWSARHYSRRPSRRCRNANNNSNNCTYIYRIYICKYTHKDTQTHRHTDTHTHTDTQTHTHTIVNVYIFTFFRTRTCYYTTCECGNFEKK